MTVTLPWDNAELIDLLIHSALSLGPTGINISITREEIVKEIKK